MKIKLKKATDKKRIYDITQLVTNVTWSGTDTQASRKLEFSVVQNPFDSSLDFVRVENGDIIYFYFDSDCKFIGRVLTKSQTSAPGEVSFSAADYMNLLLKSKVYYSFKNITPERIAAKVAGDLGIGIGELKKTGVKIKKWLVDGENAYTVIIGAYLKAYNKTKKKYMLTMNGIKLSVIEKGTYSGVKLNLTTNVTGTSIEESAEDIVNRVVILDDKGKKIGTVKDAESIKMFGIYQDIYKKEDGANPTTEAKALMKQPTKEAKVDALGDIRCISGKSVYLYDDVTGLWGKFWIEGDSHSFSGGVHTMSLDLAFQNIMEGSDINPNGKYPIATSDRACYYSTGGDKYHSARKCGSGLAAPIKTTVNEAVKIGKGKCSRCWQ
ncbi:MAG: hypothetical protein NC122_06335 [Faecalibacterium sp.]|nr:hypothetical protein [Ruminococcus sp.]MCM1392112.1 hypothetical protein [Ruminococcus sp.]MCM1485809.1 hypothetical protein [Faecalibacterium sp.]